MAVNMRKTLVLSLYAIALITGLFCYQWVYPEKPISESPSLTIKVPPSINNSQKIEQKPRWYKLFGLNQPWQYGIIPEPGIDGDAEIYEVSDTDPTKTAQASFVDFARSFRDDVMKAAYNNGWDDVNNAMNDGYSNGPPFDFLHYVNFDYTKDGRLLDPAKPEFLMYYPTSKGQVLAGAMFLTEKLYDHGPQPGGAEMIWHYHTSEQAFCFRNNVMVEFEDDNSCANGIASRRSPEMLHVWFVDHPEGPYSTEMCLPSGIIEGWEGRKTWEQERIRRYDQHTKILREKKFTVKEN